MGLATQKEFVHFALTSQDINNTALPLLIKDFLFEGYLPSIIAVRDRLHGLALDWARIPMLGPHTRPTGLTYPPRQGDFRSSWNVWTNN